VATRTEQTIAPSSRLHDAAPSVRIYVASFNTRHATELCIRSMREYAGMSFRLTVGDSGSDDGSREMLAAMAARGWLEYEVRQGRQHAEWLDDWIGRDDEGYTVFSDSDMQYRRWNWLRSLVTAAEVANAAIVYTEHLPEVAHFGYPSTLEVVRLADRPAPWLFLARPDRLKEVGVSFAEHAERRADLPEGKLVYDVGGRFFRAVEERDLALVQMPGSFRRSYRHYGGLSWIYDDSDYGRQKARERRLIAQRLRNIRLAQQGYEARAAVLRLGTELGATLSLSAQKARKLRNPRLVLTRLRALASTRA
jgi:hypothetical protein